MLPMFKMLPLHFMHICNCNISETQMALQPWDQTFTSNVVLPKQCKKEKYILTKRTYCAPKQLQNMLQNVLNYLRFLIVTHLYDHCKNCFHIYFTKHGFFVFFSPMQQLSTVFKYKNKKHQNLAFTEKTFKQSHSFNEHYAQLM